MACQCPLNAGHAYAGRHWHGLAAPAAYHDAGAPIFAGSPATRKGGLPIAEHGHSRWGERAVSRSLHAGGRLPPHTQLFRVAAARGGQQHACGREGAHRAWSGCCVPCICWCACSCPEHAQLQGASPRSSSSQALPMRCCGGARRRAPAPVAAGITLLGQLAGAEPLRLRGCSAQAWLYKGHREALAVSKAPLVQLGGRAAALTCLAGRKYTQQSLPESSQRRGVAGRQDEACRCASVLPAERLRCLGSCGCCGNDRRLVEAENAWRGEPQSWGAMGPLAGARPPPRAHAACAGACRCAGPILQLNGAAALLPLQLGTMARFSRIMAREGMSSATDRVCLLPPCLPARPPQQRDPCQPCQPRQPCCRPSG